MGEAIVHLDVIHREVKQGVEGREAGAEVIQADLDPFRPQFMQGSEGVGTLPGELAFVELKDETCGMTPSSSMMVSSCMICSWLARCLPERLMAILKRPTPEAGCQSFSCWQVRLRIWRSRS